MGKTVSQQGDIHTRHQTSAREITEIDFERCSIARRVLIAGGPTGCWTNAGDEAVFYSILRDLRAVAPAVEVSVVSSNPPGTLASYGVGEVPYNDIRQLIEAARTSDLLILGGGSIFYDYWGFDPTALLTPRHSGLSFYCGFSLLAKLLGKPLMMYSVGIGPLLTDEGRACARAAFEVADTITVRDADSARTFEELGGNPGQALLTADPAFGFESAGREHINEVLNRLGRESDEQPLLGIALREWDVGVIPEKWERETALALDAFLTAHGGQVLFVPFHKTVDWPLTDDLGVAERVAGLMQHREKTLIAPVSLSPAEKAGLLARCHLVLAMRLHAGIFALNAGVPVVALAYDPKVSALMRQAGLAEYCLDIEAIEESHLSRLLNRAMVERAALRERIGEEVHTIRDAARRSANLACELLNGEIPTAQPLTAETSDLLLSLESRLRDTSEEIARAIISAGETVTDTTEAKTCEEPSKRKRVAILTNRLLDWEDRRPRFGGAENYCLRLGSLLSELGFDVTFYQAGNASFTGDFYGFKVIALAVGEYYSEFHHGICDQFYRESLDYDHVIYNMVNYASGQIRDDALLICHGIWFDHDFYRPHFSFRSQEWFAHLHRALSRPSRVVSVDTNSINVTRALWPDVAEKMVYLPNWADTATFHPPERRQNGPVTVLFPRRGERVRGSRLLEAILKDIPHDCRIRWVGEGEAEDNEYLRGLERIDARFKFHTAAFEEMPRFYREADICVIPTVASEGTSLSCLEALASGCAVVATMVGGLPELIQPGVNGLLVNPDASELAAAVNTLIEDPGERSRLQRAGPETARHFHIDLWRERWVHLLERMKWLSTEQARVWRALCSQESAREAKDEPSSAVVTSPAVVPPVMEPEAAVLQQSAPEVMEWSGEFDVICFSIIDWNFRYQRPQQIMTQFAEHGHRVFYISISRFLPGGKLRFFVRELRPRIREVQLATYSPIDVYSGEVSPDIARYLLDDLWFLRNHFNITRAVSVVQMPTWANLAYLARERFGWPVVYDCMDDWAAFPGMETKDALHRAEVRLTREADLLVVSSQKLYAKWEGNNPDTVLARNATDYTHFHRGRERYGLADASHPVIGYYGAIASWFDLELIKRLANERPDYTFVLIGDVYDMPVEELAALPNVRVLGEKPYTELPEHLSSFDVCLVPFKIGPATDAMDVVKFYEYISQGKPVVSTPLREILAYKDYLYIAENHDDFLVKLDEAVAERDPTLRIKRLELARANTWQARFEQFRAGIERARQRLTMTELYQSLRHLLRENAEEDADNEKTLLKKAVSHLGAELSEREQAAQILSARLLDHEHTIHELQASQAEFERKAARMTQEIARLGESLVVGEQTIVAREQTVARLQGEVDSLRAQASEMAEMNRQLKEEVYEKQRLIQSQIAGAERLAAEKEHAVSAVQSKVIEKEQEIESLNMQLAEKGRTIQSISRELAQKDTQLEKITSSLGWRLLSMYGPIKYRYLLPIYRFLKLAPPAQKHLAPITGNDATGGLSQAGGVSRESHPDTLINSQALSVPHPYIDHNSNAYDVVCLPIIDWSFRYQRPQQLMSRFGVAGHRVFYIKAEFRATGEPYTIEKKAPNLYEVSLRGPDRNIYRDQMTEQSCDALFDSLNALRRDLAITASVLMVQLPFWWPLAKRSAAAFAWPIIYDCMDLHSGFSTNDEQMIRNEEELVRSASLVVASSTFLEEEARKHNSNVLLVRNGCDFEHFAVAKKIRGVRPVIGYYGAIADWFDSDLVADLAERRPDWDFVLVGSTYTADITRLSKLPNVSLPGEKPYGEIPGWLASFDVAIIPFKQTPLTRATNPVKAYEILSSGRPLVSVPLPEMVPLAPLVRLAQTAEEFEREVKAALEEDDPTLIERRREFGRENTWDVRLNTLEPAVRATFPKVSIIVVTYNNANLNRLCLESIFGRTEWPNLEVIAVDNASSDSTPEYLKQAEKNHSNLRVILNPQNSGFAVANNQALQLATGDYLILLNNDTVVPRGWLWSLIRHLHSDPGIGLIGPVTNEIGNEAKVQVGYESLEDMPVWAASYVRQTDGQTFHIPVLAMFCVAMRREVFEKIGPLDERFHIGMFEDDDYTRRVREAGLKVLCARDSFIHHAGRASFKLLGDKKYFEIFEKNRKLYEEKWGMWEPHLDERTLARVPALRERLSEIIKESGVEAENIVVFLPSIGWTTPLVQRPHHLARELGRQGFLVFFDCAGSVLDDFADFDPIERNLWIYKGPKGVLDNIERPILWTLPYNAHLVERWANRTIVYDWIDDLSVFPYRQGLLVNNHKRMIKDADLVLYVARKLESGLNGQRPDALYVPNGVEYSRFASPSDDFELDFRFAHLLTEGRPIIGYYGAIASWLDVELLSEVAEKRKDWSFAIIGKQLPDAPSLRRLVQKENVLLLSPQRYETLPAYLAHFTAAMIPFKINRITEATSPLKLYEYFAGGKPVISTPMPECQAFSEVLIARNAEEFSEALDEARKRAGEASFEANLREIARQNSWEARISSVVRTLGEKRPGRVKPPVAKRAEKSSAAKTPEAVIKSPKEPDPIQENARRFRWFRTSRNRHFFDALVEHFAGISKEPYLPSLFKFALSCNERGRQVADFLTSFIEPGGKRYLEIGCTYGGGLVAMAERGAEVTGFESDEALVRLALQNLIDNRIEAPLLSKDLMNTGQIAEYERSFDIINCNDIVKLVADPKTMVQNMATMLRPGGIALLEIQNGEFPRVVLEEGMGGVFGLSLMDYSELERHVLSDPSLASLITTRYMRYEQVKTILRQAGLEPRFIPDESSLPVQSILSDMVEVRERAPDRLESVPAPLRKHVEGLLAGYLEELYSASDGWRVEGEELLIRYGMRTWRVIARKPD